MTLVLRVQLAIDITNLTDSEFLFSLHILLVCPTKDFFSFPVLSRLDQRKTKL